MRIVLFSVLLLLGSEAVLLPPQEERGTESQPPSVLAPVYGPLAEKIVCKFGLSTKEGIGIDLGSGAGDLIIELCRRTERIHWINADINSTVFPDFIKMAKQAGFAKRVSAIRADAVELPFRDRYADIIVSRGSFQFWGDLQKAFSEIYRVLKPGGVAYIGRGFSDNLPAEIAEEVRRLQRKRGFEPVYDVAATAMQLQNAVESLAIQSYEIQIPRTQSDEYINYGLWLEFRKSFGWQEGPSR